MAHYAYDHSSTTHTSYHNGCPRCAPTMASLSTLCAHNGCPCCAPTMAVHIVRPQCNPPAAVGNLVLRTRLGAVRFRPIQPVGGGMGGGGVLSTFGRFNQWGAGVGGGVLSAFGRFNQWGGGGGRGGEVGADVSFRPIQSMRCPRFRACPLSPNSASGGCACV